MSTGDSKVPPNPGRVVTTSWASGSHGYKSDKPQDKYGCEMDKLSSALGELGVAIWAALEPPLVFCIKCVRLAIGLLIRRRT